MINDSIAWSKRAPGKGDYANGAPARPDEHSGAEVGPITNPRLHANSPSAMVPIPVRGKPVSNPALSRSCDRGRTLKTTDPASSARLGR
jgi:hypothetical protein